MILLALRLVVFALWFCLVSLVTATATSYLWDYDQIATAQVAEERSLRTVGALDPERDRFIIGLRERSSWSQEQVAHWSGAFNVDGQVQSSPGRAVVEWVTGLLPQNWWINEGRPHLIAFTETWYMRTEVFLSIFLLTLPIHALSFWMGEYWSRRKIREGAHKRNSTIRAGLWALRSFNTLGAILLGIVVMIPVVYWVPVFVVASVALTSMIRAYWIEVH